MPYTEEERQLIRYTVRETLTNIGFDMRDPLAVQADMAYLRRARHRAEMVFNKAALAVVVSLLGAIGTALAYFTRWGHS